MSAPVSLITGGGSGIGLAVAEHLINHHGHRVAILDIDASRAKRESSRLGSSNCLDLHVDVTDYAQLSRAFLQTFEWGGNRLDFFFANAGIGDTDSLYKNLSGLDEATGLPKPLDTRTMAVNLEAVIQGCHLARHFFVEKNRKPGGKILATSSVVGVYANHPMPLYSASKYGVVGLVRALAPVYLREGITVNCVCPALIETNLMPAHVTRDFHVPSETTPMSTALKAVDRVLADDTLAGQVMELTLDEVVFKHRPEYSRRNIEWMFVDQSDLWEKVCEPLLPRAPGENAARIQIPKEDSF